MPWIAASAILIAACVIRFPLLSIALDRDEGGYAYGAQRILEGGAAYADFYTMRYPAIFGAYAVLLRVFGESHWGIHLGLLFINAITGVLLFLAARRWFGAWPGVAALAVFMTLSLNGTTEGFSANSEQFVILFASVGLWVISRITPLDSDIDPKRDESNTALAFGLAGACMGVAYLMKQHGIVFAVFGFAAVLCGTAASPRALLVRCIAYGTGTAVPVALSWGHLYFTDRFDAFWFWTVDYAQAYAGGTTLREGMTVFAERARTVAPPLIPIVLLAVVGGYELVRFRSRRLAVLLGALLVFSVAGVSIGFYFRPHYFRLLFPALALLAAAGAVHCGRYVQQTRWRVAVTAGVVVFACGFTLAHQRVLLFADSPAEASRRISGINPFPESLTIAEYLRDHTSPEDTIAVFGSEPQIYFYANRRAATAHIYTYQLMEPHPYAVAMQRQMIEEIELARPAFVVSVDIPTSWLIRPDSEPVLFEWFEQFTTDRYEIAGRLEFVPTEESTYVRYVWEDAARTLPVGAPYFITLYRRFDREVE